MSRPSRVVPCPACRRASPWEGNPHRPFCSADCKQRDLGKWATESYRVPEEQTTPAGSEPDAEPGDRRKP